MAVTIVAEIGINHDGSFLKAKELIEKAKNAGADYVKFQLWQNQTFPHLKQYRIDYDFIYRAKEYAKHIQIGWFCTPFDIPSAEFLAELKMEIWKIPSNPVVVKRIDVVERIFELAGMMWWIFFSMGKTTEEEQEMFRLKVPIRTNVTWMHCISKYPCPVNEVNLSKLKKWIYDAEQKRKTSFWFPDSFGLSDHSLSIAVPVAAVALGATVIEKHLTLNRNSEGPDHKASLYPFEFAEMVKQIREVEKAL